MQYYRRRARSCFHMSRNGRTSAARVPPRNSAEGATPAPSASVALLTELRALRGRGSPRGISRGRSLRGGGGACSLNGLGCARGGWRIGAGGSGLRRVTGETGSVSRRRSGFRRCTCGGAAPISRRWSGLRRNRCGGGGDGAGGSGGWGDRRSGLRLLTAAEKAGRTGELAHGTAGPSASGLRNAGRSICCVRSSTVSRFELRWLLSGLMIRAKGVTILRRRRCHIQIPSVPTSSKAQTSAITTTTVTLTPPGEDFEDRLGEGLFGAAVMEGPAGVGDSEGAAGLF